MTREEIEKNRQYQLTDAAFNYCRKEHPHYDGEALGEITDAFEAGAEWDHKRLVEKACEWLYNNWKGEDYYMSDIIEGLRKEMEE